MTARKRILLFASALVALSAAAAPVAIAQEAIMLETFGAVRMVSPEELQRRDIEAVRQQQQQQAQPVSLPRQHADIAQ